MGSPRTGRIYVFAHGLLGFSQLRLGWKKIAYFRGLPEALHELGYAASFARTPPTREIARRAQALHRHIQGLRGEIVLIGHSMGGLDCRHLATHLDESHRIRAVVTVGSPHRGSPLAVRALTSPWALCRIARAIARPALADLTPAACARFNEQTPDREDVRYISYAGARPVEELPRILRYWSRLIQEREGDNDCMVSVSSARWGEFREVLRADHYELAGWSLAPADPAIQRPFDHFGFYRALLNELDALEFEPP